MGIGSCWTCKNWQALPQFGLEMRTGWHSSWAYFEQEDGSSRRVGVCRATKGFWNSVVWDGEKERYVLKPGNVCDTPFVHDAGDFSAMLLTQPGFGCVKWVGDDDARND